MEQNVEWRLVNYNGIPPRFYVSSNGDILAAAYIDSKGFKRAEKLLKQRKDRHGYMQVHITIDGKQRQFLAHRIIAYTFHPDTWFEGAQVNHINGNKSDNRAENLEWVTRSENCAHSFRIGLQCNKGENHPTHKLSNDDVIAIRACKKVGISTLDLARLFRVTKTTIKEVNSGKTWSHLNQ